MPAAIEEENDGPPVAVFIAVGACMLVVFLIFMVQNGKHPEKV